MAKMSAVHLSHLSQSEAAPRPEAQSHLEGGREGGSPPQSVEAWVWEPRRKPALLGIPAPAHPTAVFLFLSCLASSLSSPWIPMFIHMGKMLPQPTVTFGILSHCFGSARCHAKDAKHQKILWMLSLAYMFPRNSFLIND